MSLRVAPRRRSSRSRRSKDARLEWSRAVADPGHCPFCLVVSWQVACGLSLPRLSRHPYHGGQERNPSGIPAAAITTRCIPEQRVPIAVLWSVPAFLLLTPGGTPPLRRSPLLAACHLRLRSPKIVCEIRFTSDGPWTRILATGRPPRFEFCSKKPPTRGVMKESELWSDASLRLEPADKRNRIRR